VRFEQMTPLSVIICSHNPRRDYLSRVLEALRAQTLPVEQWELIIVDNASELPLAEEWDLSWHPLARHIREDELGLTPARLRGIAEARGELLVFVDDDNVLDPDYLQTALEIDQEFPFLGAWGGNIRGEFEAEPEEWVRSLTIYLVREVSKPVWSNNPNDPGAGPYGAGLCVRRSVATAYAERLLFNPARRQLDRTGSKLSSCGDSDLILTSCDMGQGFGSFPQLRLTHLIPENRLQAEYLIRLKQGIEASVILLRYFRTGALPLEPSTLRTWLKYALIRARSGRRQARIYRASRQATREGIRMAHELADHQTSAVSQ
jgi:glycosyltransferase involved in cell wall biosynthesis